MNIRGVSYAVGEMPLDRTLHDMRAIRGALHCNAVMLIGSSIELLSRVARIALENDLDVFFRPYLADEPRNVLLKHLADAASAAERLRLEYPGRVTLLLGGEFSLTCRGMIPGPTIIVRLQIVVRPWLRRRLDRRITNKLNQLLAEALATARASFDGPITYAAGYWERVNWADFDLVGLNLYRFAANHTGYSRQLHQIVREAPKPVIITEFGCGAFRGADQRGPGSFRIVNWWADPPRIRAGHERDEATQARYLAELISLYEDAGVLGCFVYTFFSPGFPHDPDPTFDLDMAGFGLVRTNSPRSVDWEPKMSFHAVAERFAQMRRERSSGRGLRQIRGLWRSARAVREARELASDELRRLRARSGPRLPARKRTFGGGSRRTDVPQVS